MPLGLQAANDQKADIAVGYDIGHDLFQPQVLGQALAEDSTSFYEKRTG
jgi:hypothetical protein